MLTHNAVLSVYTVAVNLKAQAALNLLCPRVLQWLALLFICTTSVTKSCLRCLLLAAMSTTNIMTSIFIHQCDSRARFMRN